LFLDERGALISQIGGEIKTGKKYYSLAEPDRFMKEAGDGRNSRALAAHCASNQHEERSGWHVAQITGRR
jgi:hypothetical protein